MLRFTCYVHPHNSYTYCIWTGFISIIVILISWSEYLDSASLRSNTLFIEIIISLNNIHRYSFLHWPNSNKILSLSELSSKWALSPFYLEYPKTFYQWFWESMTQEMLRLTIQICIHCRYMNTIFLSTVGTSMTSPEQKPLDCSSTRLKAESSWSGTPKP